MSSRDRDGKPGTPAGPGVPPRADSPDPAEVFRDLADDGDDDADDDDAPADPHGIAHARTRTLDDPLTTQLLAEVARRNVTIEISPDMVEEAEAAALAGERDPVAPAGPIDADDADDASAPSRGRG